MTLIEAGMQFLDETGADEITLDGDLVFTDLDGRKYRVNSRPVAMQFRRDRKDGP